MQQWRLRCHRNETLRRRPWGRRVHRQRTSPVLRLPARHQADRHNARQSGFGAASQSQRVHVEPGHHRRSACRGPASLNLPGSDGLQRSAGVRPRPNCRIGRFRPDNSRGTRAGPRRSRHGPGCHLDRWDVSPVLGSSPRAGKLSLTIKHTLTCPGARDVHFDVGPTGVAVDMTR